MAIPEEKILWKPNPGKQTFALTRKEFEILYGGARGGGKTDAGIVWMLRPVENPRFQGLVIRKNAEDLTDWINRAKRIYAALGGVCTGKPAIFTFPSGAVIKTGHLKDDNAFEKYLGHEYQRILIEELTLIPRYEDYEKLKSSCRSTVPDLDARIFATTNPGNAGHDWVKEYFIEVSAPLVPFIDLQTGRSRIYIPATVEDNPVLMEIDPDYVKMLEGIKDENLKKAWRYGSWDTYETEGAYYNQQFKIIVSQNRICRVPYDSSLPVHTAWDLGIGDYMSVWFLQIYGKELRWIDYLQVSDMSMIACISDLKKTAYNGNWGRHIAPHDIEVRELSSGKTRRAIAAENGIEFEIAPNLPVQDGIDAARNILTYSWFDREKTKTGVRALRNYRKDWIDSLSTWSDKPVHDWSSHGADAFRMAAVTFSPEIVKYDLMAEIKQRKQVMKQNERDTKRRLVRMI